MNLSQNFVEFAFYTRIDWEPLPIARFRGKKPTKGQIEIRSAYTTFKNLQIIFPIPVA